MRSNDWSNNEKVQRWLSARPTRNKVMEVLRETFDSGDMFGSTLMALFAVADVLQEDAPELIPDDWEYRPAMGGADTDDYNYQAIRELLEEDATIEDVLAAGIVLARLDSLNRSTGLSY